MTEQVLFGSGGGAPSAGDLIKDTDTAGFMADVIDASRNQPVLVDFWAPWCGPCKQLTPILEKVVRAGKGAVRLVKMNIDEHPQIPTQMGVQSIPAVFAFKDGRPVDMFAGVQPESQIKAFIERVAGAGALSGPEEVLASADELFEEGDLQSAGEIYAAVLGEDRENAEALAGLAKCHIGNGNLDEAEQTLALVPVAKKSNPAIASAEAMLDLARKAGGSGEVSELRRRLETNSGDHQARFDLAMSLNAQGDRAGAAEQLLDLISRQRDWNDEVARKQLVQLFEAWGPNDPQTIEGRRRLSLLLFS